MSNLQALTTNGSDFVKKLRDYFPTIGEGTFELAINLVVMVLVPGLIFFAAITAQEAVYEANEQIYSLKKLAMSIAISNILLNLYLVPFAGIFGAACATMISMIAYFIAFDVFPDK